MKRPATLLVVLGILLLATVAASTDLASIQRALGECQDDALCVARTIYSPRVKQLLNEIMVGGDFPRIAYACMSF